MRFLIRFLIVLGVITGIAAAGYQPVREWIKKRNQPEYRTTEVGDGRIRLTVNATGEIKPKLSVQIGSFVSGPIVELNAEFNDIVDEGDVLARIDPKIYEAEVARAEAGLSSAVAARESRSADISRVQALLSQAVADEKRALMLFEEDENFISDTELDSLKFNRESLEAQLDLANAAFRQAEASIEQAQSTLTLSQVNLDYTLIKAPMSGRVIDRKIDPGQTLAASFQTPELFILGIDMEEEMHIYASVDEADVGFIRNAQKESQPVRFRVDAYRDELFDGTIKEIRMGSTETQGVITYPVIVTATNPDLKLLPGMTANLTFQVEQKENVTRIPWSALRFFPKPEMVREEDRKLLTGEDDEEEDSQANAVDDLSVSEMVEAAQKRRQRHVWVQDGPLLKAIPVELGISDYKFAELVKGDIKAGQKLVTGIKSKKDGR